jgi:hypothetical protein
MHQIKHAIRLLWSEGVKTSETQRTMTAHYRDTGYRKVREQVERTKKKGTEVV